jgi:hypothetical protein
MKIIKILFLQGKFNGFVVLKTYFSSQWVENCGSDEKVNLVIFPFFFFKKRANWEWVCQFTCLSDDIYNFSYV